ncbi:hypothetical protein NMY22_g7675 [Coprinellus aureogranulatus]|nr:hypothetical protein NMY22_g7675 [Coprinellus aureogranulatus]
MVEKEVGKGGLKKGWEEERSSFQRFPRFSRASFPVSVLVISAGFVSTFLTGELRKRADAYEEERVRISERWHEGVSECRKQENMMVIGAFVMQRSRAGGVSALIRRRTEPPCPGPQEVLNASVGGNYDSGLFTPLEDLHVLSETEFTTLKHPAFPRHGVRIKKTKFCDETVNAYTGYIDVEARHLFFYFFESRNDPDEDDVILWTNGGPGCSSSLGLFMELGPCRVLDSNGTKFHPHSWNSRANIFFIDQPIGVGFSYADYGEYVANLMVLNQATTEDAAKDIAAFVHVFFEHFKKFQGRAFHMAGESYGGRYIPVFAAAVYDQNRLLVQQGLAPINLTSVMIGNGLTDFFTMSASYYDMACTPASVAPILDIQTCVRMKQAVPRCNKLLKEGCVDIYDEFSCQAAAAFCDAELAEPFFNSGRNPYDISVDCEGNIEDTLCYPVTKHISSYLDRPEVRKLIGVSPSLSHKTSPPAPPSVSTNFALTMDEYRPTYHYISNLLDRGVRALIYVGKNDWICNHVGNERWT